MELNPFPHQTWKTGRWKDHVNDPYVRVFSLAYYHSSEPKWQVSSSKAGTAMEWDAPDYECMMWEPSKELNPFPHQTWKTGRWKDHVNDPYVRVFSLAYYLICAFVGCAVANPVLPYINSGAAAGPLTAAFGDLVSTSRGLRPQSLEGFSEDVNQDGFVDPLAQAVAPVVHAAPLVHAAPVAYAHAVHAAPLTYTHAVHAVAPVEVKAVEVPKVEVKAAPVVTYAAAPAVHHIAPVAYHAPAVYHTVHHVPQVHVAKKTHTYTTHHVINHAPVVGSYLSGLPVVAAAPVAAETPAVEAAAVEAA